MAISFWVPVIRQHHIVGLEIAVQVASVVHVEEACDNLVECSSCVVLSQWALFEAIQQHASTQVLQGKNKMRGCFLLPATQNSGGE